MNKKNLPITENLNEKSPFIDEISPSKRFRLMLNDQKLAIKAIYEEEKNILSIIDVLANHLNKYKNSRIFYCGAGTSGRIGVQDGAELYPTFGWPKFRYDFIIAGGKKALIHSVENAEDDFLEAKKQVKTKKIKDNDVVICVSASGNTPFTLKVLQECKKMKVLSIGISNNPKGKILNFCSYKIILNTKEEVIAGSTRLKAGTAQKICLNTISSLVMVKLGKIRKGRMINLVPSNNKLRYRISKINELL